MGTLIMSFHAYNNQQAKHIIYCLDSAFRNNSQYFKHNIHLTHSIQCPMHYIAFTDTRFKPQYIDIMLLPNQDKNKDYDVKYTFNRECCKYFRENDILPERLEIDVAAVFRELINVYGIRDVSANIIFSQLYTLFTRLYQHARGESSQNNPR